MALLSLWGFLELTECTNSLEYPKIPRNEWKSVKIKSTEHDKIINLYNSGMGTTQIAKLYKVSYQLIHGIIHPDYRLKQAEQRARRERAYRKYKDPWVKRRDKARLDRLKRRYHEDVNFHKYRDSKVRQYRDRITQQ